MVRVALFWTPSVDDPLARAGAAWLGRDCETGASVAQPEVAGLAAATAGPRAYGFHATLRAPVRLATGWEEFCSAAAGVAARVAPFELPPLVVGRLGGFVALVPEAPCAAMGALAEACVEAVERHRLPPDEAELARRRAVGLDEKEEALLRRWGYPYVRERWRFHLTLTGRVAEDEAGLLEAAARAHFGAGLGVARRVEAVSIVTQVDGAPFLVAERLPLGG